MPNTVTAAGGTGSVWSNLDAINWFSKVEEIKPKSERQEVELFISEIRKGRRFLFANDAYLYGSRQKGYDKPNSDWDVALEYHPLLADELMMDGWAEKDLSGSYKDCFTIEVHEKTFESGARVQISLRKDLEGFKQVWRSVTDKMYYDLFRKDSTSYIGGDAIAELLNSLHIAYNRGVGNSVEKVYKKSAKAFNAVLIEEGARIEPVQWVEAAPVRGVNVAMNGPADGNAAF